jgi:structure-specific recognition protein 1
VDIPKADILQLVWSEAPRVDTASSGTKISVLRVIRKEKNGCCNFVGFPRSKLSALSGLGLGESKEVGVSVSGHNWGNMSFEESTLIFKDGEKVSFTLPLSDVQQATLGRDEVMMQLPVDDTAVDRADDALVGISFHVPKDAEDFSECDAELAASKALYDRLKPYTLDDGAGDVVASFDQVGVLVPRGRFDVEMFSSSFHLLGQAHDFRVQYSSILRIFVLPKANSPQTVVAVALDPPLRKGQTTYMMVLCQFPTDEEITLELQVSEEQLTKLNDKGAKLSKTMTGNQHRTSSPRRSAACPAPSSPGRAHSGTRSGRSTRCAARTRTTMGTCTRWRRRSSTWSSRPRSSRTTTSGASSSCGSRAPPPPRPSISRSR